MFTFLVFWKKFKIFGSKAGNLEHNSSPHVVGKFRLNFGNVTLFSFNPALITKLQNVLYLYSLKSKFDK